MNTQLVLGVAALVLGITGVVIVTVIIVVEWFKNWLFKKD